MIQNSLRFQLPLKTMSTDPETCKQSSSSNSDSDTDMAECLASSNGFEESQKSYNGLSQDQKDHVQKCIRSKRIIEEDELLRLSKQVDAQSWRQLGNALKFPFAKLDAFEAETASTSEAVHKMMLDWQAWFKEKATVSKLAKALYLNTEWEAILSLNP